MTPGYSDLFRTFGRIGLLSFGGPAGQIALMHRVLVEEKGWLDEQRFLHALNFCMLLPGPEAMQLSVYAGWLMKGVRGGLLAGLLFIGPGAAVIVTLSILFLQAGDVPIVAGLLFGLRAAVLALVIQAMAKLSVRALTGKAETAIAVAAFAGIALFAVPFPLIVLGAGAVGIVVGQLRRRPETAAPPIVPGETRRGLGRLATLAWIALWLMPLVALPLFFGGDHVFAVEARFFTKMALVTFGGAYAVLAYVGQQAVEAYGWLSAPDMLTGLGLAETTPGPLILVLVFVGFLGGARLSGFDPLVGGLGGAFVALWFTFLPSFLFILLGAPYVEALRGVRWLRDALSAVTAAVVGVIANLALWFGLHVLFARVAEVSAGPIRIDAPVLSSFDPAAAVIALGAAVVLFRFRTPLGAVLLGAALAGAGYRLVMPG